jgi:hypothetical protein
MNLYRYSVFMSKSYRTLQGRRFSRNYKLKDKRNVHFTIIFFLSPTLKTSNNDTIVEKPRVKGNAEIIQSFSIRPYFMIMKIYLNNICNKFMYSLFRQREVTQVNCINQIFSKSKEKKMWILSVENAGISLCIAVLFTKQRQSKKYIFLAKFLQFLYISSLKKTKFFIMLSLSKRR